MSRKQRTKGTPLTVDFPTPRRREREEAKERLDDMFNKQSNRIEHIIKTFRAASSVEEMDEAVEDVIADGLKVWPDFLQAYATCPEAMHDNLDDVQRALVNERGTMFMDIVNTYTSAQIELHMIRYPTKAATDQVDAHEIEYRMVVPRTWTIADVQKFIRGMEAKIQESAGDPSTFWTQLIGAAPLKPVTPFKAFCSEPYGPSCMYFSFFVRAATPEMARRMEDAVIEHNKEHTDYQFDDSKYMVVTTDFPYRQHWKQDEDVPENAIKVEQPHVGNVIGNRARTVKKFFHDNGFSIAVVPVPSDPTGLHIVSTSNQGDMDEDKVARIQEVVDNAVRYTYPDYKQEYDYANEDYM